MDVLIYLSGRSERFCGEEEEEEVSVRVADSAEKIDLVEIVDESEIERRNADDDARKKRIADFTAHLSTESREALQELRDIVNKPDFKSDMWFLTILVAFSILAFLMILAVVALVMLDKETVKQVSTVVRSWALSLSFSTHSSRNTSHTEL